MSFWTDTQWYANTQEWVRQLDQTSYIARPEKREAAYALLTSLTAPFQSRRVPTVHLLQARMVYDPQGALLRFVVAPETLTLKPSDMEFYLHTSGTPSDFCFVLPEMDQLCTLYVFRHMIPALRQDFLDALPIMETYCYD